MVCKNKKTFYICTRNTEMIARLIGEMAEWSNAAVLKTVDCNRSGGSNPSFSAEKKPETLVSGFLFITIDKCKYNEVYRIFYIQYLMCYETG